MAKERRLPWTLLGRLIGTASGWDQADTFVMQLYDFEPAKGVDLPSGTISVNFESGLVETWDEEGKPITSRDVVEALSTVPSQD
jgi:hypothetical protein